MGTLLFQSSASTRQQRTPQPASGVELLQIKIPTKNDLQFRHCMPCHRTASQPN